MPTTCFIFSVRFSRPYRVRSGLCDRLASVVVVCLWPYVSLVKRCVLKQKLLLTADMKSYIYEKSIGTKMNDFDLCLEVLSTSRQPLRYIRRQISRKPLKIKAWFQRTINRKWHMGYQMVKWPMTSRDPEMCCEPVRSAILATAWLLVEWVFKFGGAGWRRGDRDVRRGV